MVDELFVRIRPCGFFKVLFVSLDCSPHKNMSAGSWQHQAFALDARVNAHRAANHPNFRTQYIRRRSQLLREHSGPGHEAERQLYLRLRSQLLQQRYGLPCDQTSMRSWSARSSRISESPDRRGSIEDSFSRGDVFIPGDSEASKNRGPSLEENYSFVGVHHIFDQHTAPVTMVKFANNDRSLLCCSSLDGTLSICNVTASPPRIEAVLRGHMAGVTGCDWSTSNDLIASCSLDGSLRLWAVASPDSPSCLRETKDQQGAEVLCCLFQPVNSNLVVAGNSRGLVEVLNISTGIYPRGGSSKMGGRIQALAFDSSGQLLWAANDKGVIISFLLGAVCGRLSKCRRLSLGEQCGVSSLSWRAWCSREARDPCLLVNCAANFVYLFGVTDAEGKLVLKRRYPVKHKEHQIHSTFSPIMSFRQGVCIVTGSEDCCVYFYDMSSERSLNKLQGHSSPVLGVSFNYDESLLATSDQQGLVILWTRNKKKSPSPDV